MVGGILINVNPGKTKSALEAIRKIEGIKYAYAVFGRYDIVAMIDVQDIDQAAATVIDKIGSVDGVVKTETLIKTNL
ncbi:MAG TPA: Lrp/AsnC family transcriptional regulator [Syntrophaceae bacterium]|nr:Lrp/AsnC family transcriptional regulator [Syntrophaceae bacterium]